MSEITEIAITSALYDQQTSASVWDVAAGTGLQWYRGGGQLGGRCLAVGGGYVVGAERGKPSLRAWPVSSQQLAGVRLVCAGKVTALDMSGDAVHIAVGVEDKLHLYQVASGQVLGVGARHFQPISVVRFSGDGAWLVCGAEDGLVTVWNVAILGDRTSPRPIEPRYTFSDHSLPITDVLFTSGGNYARIISVSADRTCKVYQLSSGQLLLSVVCETRLSSVTIAPLECELYLGDAEGGIHEVSLRSPPRTLEYHLDSGEKQSAFIGHIKAVNCLSCSMDGYLLLSGSQDETARVWHIMSRQCLRSLSHKGPVTNAFFTLVPKQMFSETFKPSVVLHNFVRSCDVDDTSEYVIEVFTPQDLHCLHDGDTNEIQSLASTISSSTEHELCQEIDRLRTINQSLYKFSLENVLTEVKFENAPLKTVDPPKCPKQPKKNRIEPDFLGKPKKKKKKKQKQ